MERCRWKRQQKILDRAIQYSTKIMCLLQHSYGRTAALEVVAPNRSIGLREWSAHLCTFSPQRLYHLRARFDHDIPHRIHNSVHVIGHVGNVSHKKRRLE